MLSGVVTKRVGKQAEAGAGDHDEHKFVGEYFRLGFDRFHPNCDRIYRGVTKRWYSGDPDWSYGEALSSHASHAIRDGYTGIEQIANFYSYSVAVTVPATKDRTPVKLTPGKKYDMIITDPSWFAIFHYQWLAGSPATALNDPFKVVLTAARARAFFGETPAATILGRKLVYDDSLTLTVSGIVSDWGQPTDLHFTDFIAGRMIATQAPKEEVGDKLTVGLQPLADLHFDARYSDLYSRKVHRPTLYAMAGVAVFILLLAIINFINLSTAQALATIYPTEVFQYSVFKEEVVKFYAEEQRLSTLINTAMGSPSLSPVWASLALPPLPRAAGRKRSASVKSSALLWPASSPC